MRLSETLSAPSFRINWFIMILLLGLDFGSKIWVRTNVPLYEITGLLTNFVDLTHVQNRGVSFSLFADFSDSLRIPLLVGVSLVAIAAMLYYQTRYWQEFIHPFRTCLCFTGSGRELN